MTTEQDSLSAWLIAVLSDDETQEVLAYMDTTEGRAHIERAREEFQDELLKDPDRRDTIYTPKAG